MVESGEPERNKAEESHRCPQTLLEALLFRLIDITNMSALTYALIRNNNVPDICGE